MTKFYSRISRKLNNDKGESLGEVLVALLIVVLASTMMVTMIAAASKATTKSKDTMSKYYGDNNSMLAKAENENVSQGTGAVTIDSETIAVNIYSYEEGGKTITFYEAKK